MKKFKSLLIASVVFAGAVAQAEDLPVDIYNFFRVEYDDNVFTTGENLGVNKVDSMVIVEQVEFLFDTMQGNTYFGLRYSPSYLYYEDRPDDDSDWNHQWDLLLEHDFTSRTSAQFKHTLRKSEEPELVADDVTFRNNNGYLYNAVDANVSTQVVPEKTTLKAIGRFVDFAYDQSEVAEISDYQELSGGVDVIQALNPETSLTGGFYYRDYDYESPFRDGEIYRLSVSASKVFNPKFHGVLGLGYEQQNASDANVEDIDAPYADVSLVLLPAQATKLTLGAGYGLEKSPVNTFSTQERARLTGSWIQDLTADLTLRLIGTYTNGSFDQDSATTAFDPAVNSDGDEDTISVLSALVYQLDVRNSFEVSWRYTELESDVRPRSDYDRNRYYFGWKYNL